MSSDRERLRKIITSAPYGRLSPGNMVPVLNAIQQLAQLDGLLAFESSIEKISDEFLRHGLTYVIEGINQNEVAVRCLKRLPDETSVVASKRNLLSTYFILLLQIAEPGPHNLHGFCFCGFSGAPVVFPAFDFPLVVGRIFSPAGRVGQGLA